MSELNNHFDCAVCGLTNKDFNFYGISDCNHPICGICAIKLAKFSKDIENVYDYSKCVICKQNMSKIIISGKISLYSTFNEANMISLQQYGLLFDGAKAQKFYEHVVRIQCQDCNNQFSKITELVDHVEIHRKRYCTLCVQFNKCLPSEFILMTDNNFHYHNTKQHPKCDFCATRFYDNSHLIKHAKESHFLCDICNRRQGFVAYNTQNELLKHYNNDHHVCEICRNAGNINVFDSEYKLKTHKVLEHDNKGLVTEGLMNINYGDTNNRYGSRRRARDNDENVFDEVLVPDNQQLPEMACEQEFPPLNADTSSQNRQLGVKSTTNDDNDARGAFVKKNGHQEETRKQPPVMKPKEAMATNVAYTSKKSIGNLNENDFPSLSTDVRVNQNHTTVEYNRFSNTQPKKESFVPNKKLNSDEDFPALSGKHGPSSATPQWKASVKSKPISHSNKPVTMIKAPVQSSYRAREPSPENHIEVDMELERELAYQPKIQYMTQEEFKQNNATTKNNVASRPLPPPQEWDFPILGNAKNANAQSSKTVAGAWGDYVVATQKPKVKEQKFVVTEKFTANSPLDFPELPFKSKQEDNFPSNPKQKNKKTESKPKKKDNFAGAAASSNGPTLKATVYSMKSEAPPKTEISMSNQDSGVDYSYTYRQGSSASRNLDYVPHVVPTNENVVLVDSKKFADMKNPKSTSSPTEKQLSHNYESDFPSAVSGGGPPVSNPYSVLQDSSVSNDAFDSDRRATTAKPEVKLLPKLSSNADFPSLGPRKPTVHVTEKIERPKKTVNKRTVVETNAPAMSLADIALSVTNKIYTPFPDTDDRNQRLYEAVSSGLVPEMAQRFLALSSMYRSRKISVQIYLDSVKEAFETDLDFISAVLPQMVVLLPDISLQKTLMNHLVKEDSLSSSLSSSLRECIKCGQVIDKDDLEAHATVAHQ